MPSLIFLVMAGKPLTAVSPTISYQRDFVFIQENSVKGSNTPPWRYTGQIRAIRAISWGQNELVRENILSCLIKKESNGNIYAIGDDGTSFGILQFKKQTFETFSKKYNLVLDINNPEHQILLAKKMIGDGYGFHWTTFQSCK